MTLSNDHRIQLPRYLTVNGAMKMTGVKSRRTWNRWVKNLNLTVYKMPRCGPRFSESEVANKFASYRRAGRVE